MTVAEQAPGKPARRRWVRWVVRILIGAGCVLIFLVYGVGPFLLSRLITRAGTRPMDRALKGTPADFGVQYSEVTFPASDGVVLSGWLLPEGARHVTIIYSHGLFRSRREMLARAIDLWRLGYGGLLYDSRNHGESGKSTTSLGYFERFDVEGAIKYLKDVRHTDDKIVLMGVSMGAVADLLCAAETPRVSAVVADSAFLDFNDTVAHHVRIFFHLPAFPMANEIEFYVQRRAGFDGQDLSPLKAVKSIGNRPILFIDDAHDRRIPTEITRQLFQASECSESRILMVHGPGSERHGHAYFVDPSLYIKTVSDFLAIALR